MPVSVRNWCVVAVLVLLSLGEARAQNAKLAWDQPDSNSTIGYTVTIDGLMTDYGISPLGAGLAGLCGCAIPVPFSGGHHNILVTAYGLFGQLQSQMLYVGPVADLGGPYDGSAGTAVAFDGGKSTSPNGWIVNYE